MDSPAGATPYRVAGCPIRRSSDHCVVARSPMLFAAAHVLLRHPAPRHPPHAFVPSSQLPCLVNPPLSPREQGCSRCDCSHQISIKGDLVVSSLELLRCKSHYHTGGSGIRRPRHEASPILYTPLPPSRKRQTEPGVSLAVVHIQGRGSASAGPITSWCGRPALWSVAARSSRDTPRALSCALCRITEQGAGEETTRREGGRDGMRQTH